MKTFFPLLILYSNQHRNGLNALLGALENTDPEYQAHSLLFPNEPQLLQALSVQGRCLVVNSMMSLDVEKRIRFFEKIRAVNPAAHIAVGGPHITTGDPMIENQCHWIVRGEGEAVFSQVVKRFLAGENPKNPQIITGHPVELDRFHPFPQQIPLIGPIELMRGCPFGCTFCQTGSLFGSKTRERSPEAVFETVRRARVHRKSLDLRFITPNAFAYRSPNGVHPNPHAVHDFLSELRKITGQTGRIFFGSFPSEVRPDSINPDLLTVVRSLTDNHRLVIGAQSGSDRTLKRLHRGHTREDILIGAERSIQAGFEVMIDFIFGLPGESEQDIQHTMKTVQLLVDMGARIHAHSFLPLPGTSFSSETPQAISPSLRRFLGSLARQGHLFGQWQTQEHLGRQLTRQNLIK